MSELPLVPPPPPGWHCPACGAPERDLERQPAPEFGEDAVAFRCGCGALVDPSGGIFRSGDRVLLSLPDGRTLPARVESQQGAFHWLIRLLAEVDDDTMSLLQTMPGVRSIGYIPQSPPVPGRPAGPPQLWRDQWIVSQLHLSTPTTG
jgi:hypothetical protein